jgi:hypothetical protein
MKETHRFDTLEKALTFQRAQKSDTVGRIVTAAISGDDDGWFVTVTLAVNPEIEPIARMLCEFYKLDPEEQVTLGDGRHIRGEPWADWNETGPMWGNFRRNAAEVLATEKIIRKRLGID